MSSPDALGGAGITAAAPHAVAAPAAYTRTAMLLHWLIAALIAATFPIGLTMADMHMSVLKIKLFAYHKWIGITVLGLALIRLLWRSTHRPPEEVPMPRWQLRTAVVTHWLLYALIIAVPLAGWTYSSASGYSVVYLKLWRLPDLVPRNEQLAATLVEVHKLLAWTLLWVVVLHALAAFKHHFVDRDATLQRMLAWRPRAAPPKEEVL